MALLQGLPETTVYPMGNQLVEMPKFGHPSLYDPFAVSLVVIESEDHCHTNEKERPERQNTTTSLPSPPADSGRLAYISRAYTPARPLRTQEGNTSIPFTDKRCSTKPKATPCDLCYTDHRRNPRID